jgi:cobalt-zinc-cadmium efflux system membrane fusion protein
MKSTIYIITFFISLLFACSKKTEQQTPPGAEKLANDIVTFTVAQEASAKIKTGLMEERLVSSSIKVSGRLEAPPQNLVTISAPFAGFVKSTELLQGMVVKKGQILAEMQHPDYIQFQQDYLEAKGQLDFLDAEYKRQQELAKENINSEKSLQQAKSNYTSTLAKVQGLKAKLTLMNLDIVTVEKGEFSSVMRLYSPIDGFVTDIRVNIGKYVSPIDVMFKIVNTKHLHAELRVFEKDVLSISKGQTITFMLGADTTKRKAEVYLVGREIGEDRTVNVHGHIEKEEVGFMPGMYLHGEIETNPIKATVLPREAVVSHEGTPYIFVSIGSQQYKMIAVQTGVEVDGMIQVMLPEKFDGSQPVVVTGAYSLLSKMKNGQPEF